MIKSMSMNLESKLRDLLGDDIVADDPDTLTTHSGDKWFAAHEPDVVVFARSTNDISKLLQFASREKVPVTARGGGFGYVGGCVPVRGGIALSLAQMNRIKEISFSDAVAVVEPGAVTADLKAAVRAQKLFYPPDPASMKDCTIGGNVATNAGGPRCLKYGVTRNYVIGLEVVLASGEVLRTGGRVHKNKTGFDLIGLFVGSEGSVRSESAAIRELLEKRKPNVLEMAIGEADCEKLWALRRQFSNSLRATGLTKLNEDVVVPRSRLVDLIEFAEKLQTKYGFPVACFGHAGDGNIHVNIMADRYNRDAGVRETVEHALDD